MSTKSVALVLTVVLCSASVWAVSFIGTPTAELKQGQWSAGFNYTYSTQDLDKTNTKWSRIGASGNDRLSFKDFNVNRYYGVLAYGVADWWEVYAQLGFADTKLENKFDGGTYFGLNYDNDFAWGFGTRFTVAEQDNIRWGLSAQVNMFDTSVDFKGAGGKDTYTVDGYDFTLAFGPTIDMGGWSLYGGPFYYCLNGDWENTFSGNGFKEKGDLSTNSHFGGFIGAVFEVAENTTLTTEFSATSDGWALGTGIKFAF